jgi:hypothetical protein
MNPTNPEAPAFLPEPDSVYYKSFTSKAELADYLAARPLARVIGRRNNRVDRVMIAEYLTPAQRKIAERKRSGFRSQDRELLAFYNRYVRVPELRKVREPWQEDSGMVRAPRKGQDGYRSAWYRRMEERMRKRDPEAFARRELAKILIAERGIVESRGDVI